MFIESILSKSRRLLLVVAMLIASPTFADDVSELPSGKYSLDLTHASVVWKVSHFGLSNYVGRFTDFAAELSLNTKDLSKSSVDVSINVDSIATAFPHPEEEDFDSELENDWFLIADHPTIIFKSTSASGLIENKMTVSGDLTLLGVTKQVTMDVVLNGAMKSHPRSRKAVVGFSASASIDRTNWGLSKYAPMIGAVVTVDIEGEFIHANEQP